MDKLKPLITHKFWIILFIALILPVVGWSMATGSLAKEIDERKTAIDKAFTDAQIAPNPPNDTWSSALREINKKKENYIGESNKFVWEKQKEMFVWPPEIAPLMEDVPYKGEISRVALNLYRSAYKFEIERAHKVANPFNIREGKGLVQLDINAVPHVPLNKWKTLPPTSEEMWEAQEDVWLVTSILEAIAKVNKGAANISEAPVRKISVLELRGGTPGDDGSAPSGGGMDGMEGMAGMEGDMGMGGGGGMFGPPGGGASGGMMDGGQNGTLSIDVDMDLMKIFGNNSDGSAGGDGGEMGDSMSAEGMGMVPGGMAGGMGQSENLKRYYDDEEGLPYKTRAFYLKATIQSSKLPDLLASLSSMPWPTKIVRVQFGSKYDDNMMPIVSDTGGGAMRGGGMGGSAGGDFGSEGGFGSSDFGPAGGAGVGVGGFGIEADASGSGAGMQPGAENRSLLEAAMDDPELAVVTIAGLMTLYNPYTPPEGSEEMAQNDPAQQPDGQAMETPDGQQATPADTENPVAETPAGTPAAPGTAQPAASGLATPGNAPGQPAAQPGSPPATPGNNNNSPPAAQPAAGTQPETTQPPQNEPPSEPAANTNQ